MQLQCSLVVVKFHGDILWVSNTETYIFLRHGALKKYAGHHNPAMLCKLKKLYNIYNAIQ